MILTIKTKFCKQQLLLLLLLLLRSFNSPFPGHPG